MGRSEATATVLTGCGMNPINSQRNPVLLCSCAHEFSNAGARYQMVRCGRGKHLPLQTNQQLTHILTPLAKATAINACDNLITSLPRGYVRVSLGLQLLDAGNLVPSSAIFARDLGLNNNDGTHLVRNTRIRGLSESWDPLSAPGFSIGHIGFTKSLLCPPHYRGIFCRASELRPEECHYSIQNVPTLPIRVQSSAISRESLPKLSRSQTKRRLLRLGRRFQGRSHGL